MYIDSKVVIIHQIDKEVLYIIETQKLACHIKCHYQKTIQVVNMISHIMAIMGAIIISFIVVYLAHDWDIPRRFFYHGLECTGNIGGGCI